MARVTELQDSTQLDVPRLPDGTLLKYVDDTRCWYFIVTTFPDGVRGVVNLMTGKALCMSALSKSDWMLCPPITLSNTRV